MSVPIVRTGSGVSFFFRPFFGVPVSDSDSSGSWSVSTRSSPVFSRGLPFCDKKKACFASNEVLEKVEIVENNQCVTLLLRMQN